MDEARNTMTLDTVNGSEGSLEKDSGLKFPTELIITSEGDTIFKSDYSALSPGKGAFPSLVFFPESGKGNGLPSPPSLIPA